MDQYGNLRLLTRPRASSTKSQWLVAKRIRE